MSIKAPRRAVSRPNLIMHFLWLDLCGQHALATQNVSLHDLVLW